MPSMSCLETSLAEQQLHLLQILPSRKHQKMTPAQQSALLLGKGHYSLFPPEIAQNHPCRPYSRPHSVCGYWCVLYDDSCFLSNSSFSSSSKPKSPLMSTYLVHRSEFSVIHPLSHCKASSACSGYLLHQYSLGAKIPISLLGWVT